jgi:uncharacterized phiE125 gp8 family phage protein
MGVHIVTPPAIEPVSLAAAKLFLRVAHDADDGLIARLVTAARVLVEQSTGRALVTRRIRETRDEGVAGYFRCAVAPVSSVHAVKCRGVSLSAGAWRVSGEDDRIVVITGVVDEVEYDAGYGEGPEDAPQPLRHALLLTIAALYEARAVDGPMPAAAHALVAPYVRLKL